PSAGFEPARSRGRNPALCPLSYEGSCKEPSSAKASEGILLRGYVDPAKRTARSRMVRAVGFEPTTSWFQARSAARLRHALNLDHPAGLEPATSRSATGCSRPLSYGWIRYRVSGTGHQASGIKEVMGDT